MCSSDLGDTSPSGVDPQKEKPNKLDAFNAALAEIGGEPRTAATTPGPKKGKKDDAGVEGTPAEAQQAADAGVAAADKPEA